MNWTEIAPAGSDAGSGEQRTFVLVGDPGDDALDIIGRLAEEQQLSAAQITAVGAFAHATVGWFDRSSKGYRRIHIDQQCELLSLLGDIATDADSDTDTGADSDTAGSPAVHVHAVLGLVDGTVRGGHLLKAEVWPTLEVIVREAPAQLRKTFRPDIGLALIDLDRGSGTRDTGGGHDAAAAAGDSV